MQRAQRWASDMVNSGQTANYQNALNFAMAQLSSDWQRGQVGQQPDWVAGTNLGWDPRAFRYNEAGAKYNDEIDYANPTKVFGGAGAQGAGYENPAAIAAGAAKKAADDAAAAAAPTAPVVATPAAPGGGDVADVTGSGGGGGGGPQSSLTTNENATLEDDDMRLQYILNKMGFGSNRSRRNFAGLAATKNVKSYFNDWRNAMGVGNEGLEDLGGLAQKFAGYMGQHGGLGNIRNDANAARDRLQAGNEVYSDPELIALMTDLGNLGTVGAGDIFRAGRANRIDDAMSDYRQSYVGPGGIDAPGDYTPQDTVMEFLRNNPRYNFITGRK